MFWQCQPATTVHFALALRTYGEWTVKVIKVMSSLRSHVYESCQQLKVDATSPFAYTSRVPLIVTYMLATQIKAPASTVNTASVA